LKLFGTGFGNAGSAASINAYVALIKRSLEPKAERRGGIKRRTKN
jgi:hypothetical protein